MLTLWTVLLLCVTVLVVKTQLAGILSSSPDLALRFAPNHAESLARLAVTRQSGADGRRLDLQGAQEAALAALRRDPLVPSAWRVLSTSVLRDPAQVEQRLEFAETLSRRDIPTQLALIEHTSLKGDVAATLRRYDTVMRVSPAYDQIMFPALTNALNNPIVLRAVAKRLPEAPWRRRFFSYLVEGGANYSQQATVFQALATQGRLLDSDIVALQASRAAAEGQFDAALALYRLVNPAGAAMLLRNPDFSQQNSVAPFDWELEAGGFVNVGVTGLGEDTRLEMASVRGDGGQAARQLLQLAPGRYRISARIGPIEGYDEVSVSIALACTNGLEISGFELKADRAQDLGGAFRVPGGCPAQWLAIRMGQDSNAGRIAAWISEFSLVRETD